MEPAAADSLLIVGLVIAVVTLLLLFVQTKKN